MLCKCPQRGLFQARDWNDFLINYLRQDLKPWVNNLSYKNEDSIFTELWEEGEAVKVDFKCTAIVNVDTGIVKLQNNENSSIQDDTSIEKVFLLL